MLFARLGGGEFALQRADFAVALFLGEPQHLVVGAQPFAFVFEPRLGDFELRVFGPREVALLP